MTYNFSNHDFRTRIDILVLSQRLLQFSFLAFAIFLISGKGAFGSQNELPGEKDMILLPDETFERCVAADDVKLNEYDELTDKYFRCLLVAAKIPEGEEKEKLQSEVHQAYQSCRQNPWMNFQNSSLMNLVDELKELRQENIKNVLEKASQELADVERLRERLRSEDFMASFEKEMALKKSPKMIGLEKQKSEAEEEISKIDEDIESEKNMGRQWDLKSQKTELEKLKRSFERQYNIAERLFDKEKEKKKEELANLREKYKEDAAFEKERKRVIDWAIDELNELNKKSPLAEAIAIKKQEALEKRRRR